MRSSEARSRALIEAVPDAVVCLSRDGTQLDVLLPPDFMVADAEAYGVGKNVEEVLPPETAHQVIKQIGQAIKTGQVQTCEYQLSINGEIHTREARIVAISPDEVLAIIRNITEQKRAEEALRESQVFSRAVLNSLAAIVAVLDKTGTIIAVNQAWETFAHQNGGDLPVKTGVGLNYLDVCRRAYGPDAQEAPQALAGLQAVLAGSQRLFTLEYPCHSPTKNRWFLMRAAPLLNSQTGVVVAHIDHTERKQIEEALRQSEARLDGIINTATDAIITVDSHQRIVLFNPAAEQLFRYRAEEVLGQPLEMLLPERFRTTHWQRVRQLERTNEFARSMGEPGEFQGRRATGEEFPVEAMVSQIEVAGQKFYTVILRDITEQQRFEKERTRLFEAVSQQREQLRALSARLAEAEETERRQLARELHDQVGQNLTALGLHLNIIRSRISNVLPKTDVAQVRLAESLTLVEEMAERIRDVMANLRPPVLDDYGLVAALRWYGNRFAVWTGLTVTIQGKEIEPRLAAPVENALFRVTQEALTNVAKHAQATQVAISIEADPETVYLSITDDGIGFEPAKITGSVTPQGWGLLTMSERTEAVGGWFRIESGGGQGTKIIVEVAR